ncbi:hypothetical protein ACLMJK_001497 [Lecanora helva]
MLFLVQDNQFGPLGLTLVALLAQLWPIVTSHDNESSQVRIDHFGDGSHAQDCGEIVQRAAFTKVAAASSRCNVAVQHRGTEESQPPKKEAASSQDLTRGPSRDIAGPKFGSGATPQDFSDLTRTSEVTKQKKSHIGSQLNPIDDLFRRLI